MTHADRKKILISEKIGEVTVQTDASPAGAYLMVLAHGAGAGMDHPFLQRLTVALSEYGIGTVRFNFPYMEHGKKRPDIPAVAHQTIEKVLAYAHESSPGKTMILAGKSFGGRMGSQFISETGVPYVKAIIFYGFPLHPANKPGVERAAHLQSVQIPMLFLQGTRDALADQGLIRGVCSSIPNATLVEIEGADHSFKVGKKDAIVDLAKKSFDYLRSQQIL